MSVNISKDYCSRILSDYYCCNIQSFTPCQNEAHLDELIEQENGLIQRADNVKVRGKVKISHALLSGSYRLYLKIDVKKQSANCTALSNVVVNPKASFLDRLLINTSSFLYHRLVNSSTNLKNDAISNSGSSSRIVLVTIEINKNAMKSQKTDDHINSSLMNIARNGIIYADHHYQFLLSKDPGNKMAYFLRDDDKSFVPNAAAFRRYIADFSREPSVSRAGKCCLLFLQ